MPLKTCTNRPPSRHKSSTKSNWSGSANPWATSGKYQPVGGGGRRCLFLPSNIPCRWSILLIVERPIGCVQPSRRISSLIASAPYSPRELFSLNSLRKRKTHCSMWMLVRFRRRWHNRRKLLIWAVILNRAALAHWLENCGKMGTNVRGIGAESCQHSN